MRHADARAHGGSTEVGSRAVSDTAEPTVAAAIVLAAGEGTRMKSSTPKVLHEICGRSMLGARADGDERGEPRAARRRHRQGARAGRGAPDRDRARRDRGLPSHRKTALGMPSDWLLPRSTSATVARSRAPSSIAPGDTPLLSAASMRTLADHRANTNAPGLMLSANVPDPAGYGRVVRDRWSRVEANRRARRRHRGRARDHGDQLGRLRVRRREAAHRARPAHDCATRKVRSTCPTSSAFWSRPASRSAPR